MSSTDVDRSETKPPFSSSDIGAIAHLFRGELYRSTVWRTRLDSTTNWSVVTTGIALTVSFRDANASPMPLLLAGLLCAVFLFTEARRYRFYDFWRIRAHVLEVHFYGPMLLGQGPRTDNGWNRVLAEDYRAPRLHISLWHAMGRRIRRNYAWIFLIQAASFFGKLLVHPEPIATFADIAARAALGPIPGSAVIGAGILFHGSWAVLALATLRNRRGVDGRSDALLALAQGHTPDNGPS